MFSRLLVLIVFGVILAATLLQIRQRRLETAHDIATLQRRIDQERYELWNLQAMIARQLSPSTLQRSLVEAGVDLEPAVVDPLAPHAELVRWVRDREGAAGRAP